MTDEWNLDRLRAEELERMKAYDLSRQQVEESMREVGALRHVVQSLRFFTNVSLKTLAKAISLLLKQRGEEITFDLKPQRKVYLNAFWRGIHLLVADGHIAGFCVYAGVGTDHPFCRTTGEALSVPGGVSYYGWGLNLPLHVRVENLWYLGFDTGARPDGPQLDLEGALLEAKVLAQQLQSVRFLLPQADHLN